MKELNITNLLERYADEKVSKSATGPKSDEGKARSAQNSYKHGLTASVNARIALTGEAKARFDELLAEYKYAFKPYGQLEADLVLQYTWALYCAERATRMESEAIESDFSVDGLKVLEKIQLYRQRHERHALRLKKELGQVQADRFGANEVNRLLEKQGFCHNISAALPAYRIRYKHFKMNVFAFAGFLRDGLQRWPGDHGRKEVAPYIFDWCAEEDLRQAALVA